MSFGENAVHQKSKYRGYAVHYMKHRSRAMHYTLHYGTISTQTKTNWCGNLDSLRRNQPQKNGPVDTGVFPQPSQTEMVDIGLVTARHYKKRCDYSLLWRMFPTRYLIVRVNFEWRNSYLLSGKCSGSTLQSSSLLHHRGTDSPWRTLRSITQCYRHNCQKYPKVQRCR